jgi:methylated-DNA-[protein]-cysteine S-methyltransferase
MYYLGYIKQVDSSDMNKGHLLHSIRFESPIGSLQIISSAQGIRLIQLPGRATWNSSGVKTGKGDHPILVHATDQLAEYFAGTRKYFDIPLDLYGTQFQLEVWQSLTGIGYGETNTYSQQAKKIGRPKAARAVGGANAANPIPIVLPCHRIIGANGSLTGYGGGTSLLHIKQYLLDFENRSEDPGPHRTT